jgi:membrane protein involved in colicin uptake
MSSNWMDKAKEVAKQTAVEAKKIAESAKNANYSEMFDKTKNMAMRAAVDAKKAAGNIMNKETETSTKTDTIVPSETEYSAAIMAKLEQVERLLNEIKRMLPLK